MFIFVARTIFTHQMQGLFFVFAFLCLGSNSFSQTITIHFSGIRNTEGQLQIQFYNSKEAFEKEQPMFTKWVPKKEVQNGSLTVSYSGLKTGTYGVAILDDENANRKMDYGLVLPKEGFGFSDYYHTGMTKPGFDNFKFVLQNEKKAVHIKVRYL